MGPTYHLLESWRMKKLEELMHRLYTENRMSGDEMRDWGNWLHANLGRTKEDGLWTVDHENKLVAAEAEERRRA